MECHRISSFSVILILWLTMSSVSFTDSTKNPVRRYHHLPQDSTHAQSLYIPQVIGYNYPGPHPIIHKPNVVRHETIVASASAPIRNTASVVTATPKPQTVKPTIMTVGPTKYFMTSVKVKATTEVLSTTEETNSGRMSDTTEEISDARNALEASAATQDDAKLLKGEQMPQIETIDVACGKERMTVRITFDERFNGIIYAKGHYNDPNCRFIGQNSGQKVYQFDMVVGQCGVAFIDAGLTSGGMAFVEGTVVSILELGVQEAWDAARRIRCMWEGNIDQTVTFPLSINMLDSQTLTFSGDTASASLEIQTGRGPRAQPVQGLVRIGELLTAVVTVQGDTDFDLVVRNCVATDGTQENRIILSDNMGCAMKPKLMGEWKKMKSTGNVAAFAYLSAFKFPDVMDLFLECTVSLCKGACDECPESMELKLNGTDTEARESDNPRQNDVGSEMKVNSGNRRRRRSLEEKSSDKFNESVSGESLRLRRVVHVVGPDDLPEVSVDGLRPTVYGHCTKDCFSLLGVISTALATLLVMFATLALCGALRRSHRDDKW